MHPRYKWTNDQMVGNGKNGRWASLAEKMLSLPSFFVPCLCSCGEMCVPTYDAYQGMDNSTSRHTQKKRNLFQPTNTNKQTAPSYISISCTPTFLGVFTADVFQYFYKFYFEFVSAQTPRSDRVASNPYNKPYITPSKSGRPGGLVVALECYWCWSVSSNPAVARFWIYLQK